MVTVYSYASAMDMYYIYCLLYFLYLNKPFGKQRPCARGFQEPEPLGSRSPQEPEPQLPRLLRPPPRPVLPPTPRLPPAFARAPAPALEPPGPVRGGPLIPVLAERLPQGLLVLDVLVDLCLRPANNAKAGLQESSHLVLLVALSGSA